MGNLAEAGEFSIDLYTMPDMLTTKLWEHLVSGPTGGTGEGHELTLADQSKKGLVS